MSVFYSTAGTAMDIAAIILYKYVSEHWVLLWFTYNSSVKWNVKNTLVEIWMPEVAYKLSF